MKTIFGKKIKIDPAYVNRSKELNDHIKTFKKFAKKYGVNDPIKTMRINKFTELEIEAIKRLAGY